MKNINMSKRRYENLKQLLIPEGVMSTEANFYKFMHLGKPMVFKELLNTSGAVFANKLYTLEMLDVYRQILPYILIIPEKLVTVDNEIKGFALPFVSGNNLELYLKDTKYSVKDKLFYLKQIGQILSKLKSIRNETQLDCIYLNDLHASNFIVDPRTKKLKVIDIDSCRICDSKPSIARYLTPFSLLNKAPGNNKYEIYQKNIVLVI